jgi:hypothetical protein
MSTVPIVVTFVGAMGSFALWVYFLVRMSALREVRGPQEAVDRADSLPASATWASPVRAQRGLADRRLVQRLAIVALAGLLLLSVYQASTKGSIRNPG